MYYHVHNRNFVCCSGSITTRTHTGDKVVNKLSKFQTTAGVDEMVKRSNPNDTSSASGSSPPNYSSAVVPSVHTWGNPRSPPLPSPLQLEAMAQIKQPYTAPDTTNNMPTSSITDELPMLQRSDVICVAAIFASRRARTLPNSEFPIIVRSKSLIFLFYSSI